MVVLIMAKTFAKNKNLIFFGVGIVLIGLAISAYFIYQYYTKPHPWSPLTPGMAPFDPAHTPPLMELVNTLNQGPEHQCLTITPSTNKAAFVKCGTSGAQWRLYSDQNQAQLWNAATNAFLEGNATSLVGAAYKGDDAQTWEMVEDGKGTWRLKNKEFGWCLDAIHVWDKECNNATSAGWSTKPVG